MRPGGKDLFGWRRRVAGLSLLVPLLTEAQPTEFLGGGLGLETASELTYTDNLFLNREAFEDIYLSIEPRVVYRREAGIFRFQAELGNRMTAYRDADDLNAQDWRTSLRLSGPHRDRSRLRVEGEASWEEQSDVAREVGAQVVRDTLRLRGSAQWRANEKTELRVAGELTEDQPEGNAIDSRTTDLRLEGLWIYSENLNLLGGYRLQTIDYDGLFGDLSLGTDTLYVGLRGEVTEKLSGSLELGYSLAEEDFRANTLFYAVDLEWEESDKRRWYVRGQRDTEASLIGDDLINTRLELGVVQAFREKISGTASIGAGRLERSGAFTRSDDLLSAGVGLSFAMDAGRSLAADLRYEDSSSTDAFNTYSSLTATLSFNLRF